MRTRKSLESKVEKIQSSLDKLREKYSEADQKSDLATKSFIQKQITQLEQDLIEPTCRLEEIKEKEAEYEAEQEAQRRADNERMMRIVDYIYNQDMYYDSSHGDVLTYYQDGEIKAIPFNALALDMCTWGWLKNISSISHLEVAKAFAQINRLKREGRSYETIDETELRAPGYNLRRMQYVNELRKDKDNTYFHPFYVILFDTVGAGVKEQSDYLQQYVLRKFDDVRRVHDAAPACCSKGNVGWTTFYNDYLKPLFGEKNVHVGGIDTTNGDFNGHLAGKLWTIMEEAVTDKINKEREKQTTGNRNIIIHAKHKEPISALNLISKMYSTNDYRGAIALENNSSDRRWCVWNNPIRDIPRPDGTQISSHLTLALNIEVIMGFERLETEMRQVWEAQQMKNSVEQGSDYVMAPYPYTKETVIDAWIAHGVEQLHDLKQQAAFMNYLYQEHGACLSLPKLLPLDNEFTRISKDLNKPLWRQFVDEVFDDKDFTHIKCSDLDEFVFKNLSRFNHNPRSNNINSNTIEAYVRSERCVTVEFDKIRVGDKGGVRVWKLKDVDGPFTSNYSKYFDGEGTPRDLSEYDIKLGSIDSKKVDPFDLSTLRNQLRGGN